MIIPLLKGLSLTLKRFFSKPITISYPEKRKPIPERWRGMHYFNKNEKGETTCVACGLCVAICPSHCIYLEIGEREEGKRYPIKYEIDALRCIFCGFCQEACPVNAITPRSGLRIRDNTRDGFRSEYEKLLPCMRGKNNGLAAFSGSSSFAAALCLSIISVFALMMVTRRNPIHCALWLIVTFFSLAHYLPDPECPVYCDRPGDGLCRGDHDAHHLRDHADPAWKRKH